MKIRIYAIIIFICLFLHRGNLVFADEVINPGAQGVHDPCIIKQGIYYYVFSTGDGIEIRRSADLYNWEFIGRVFSSNPQWVVNEVPGVSNLWAPDISYRNGKYCLYYAASTFGSNTSRIGLVSNTTLNPSDPEYQWVDEGKVIGSNSGDNYNTIDGNVIQDTSNQWWLAFGSFWSGIKMTSLDAATGKPNTSPVVLNSIASRPGVAYNPIEAPFIIYKNGYYYLFVSFDFCCQGIYSTYNIRAGRSASVTGPYVDRDGVPMISGGGTLVMQGDTRWKGTGHNAVLSDNGQDYLVYHAYDALNSGMATLRIQRLEWTTDLWPMAGDVVTGLVTNPIAWWNFEDGTAGFLLADTNSGANPAMIGSRDLSGNGNDLMAWNSSVAPRFSESGQTPETTGLSVVFEGGGKDAYTGGANVIGTDIRTITPGQWTIEASVYFTSLNGWQTFIGRDGSGIVTSDSRLCPLYFQKTVNNNIQIQFATADGQLYNAAAGWTVQTGRWYHVVGRSSGTSLDLFIDKLDGNGFILEASTAMTGNTALSKSSDTLPWVIGRAMWNGGLVDYVSGMVDNVRITTAALQQKDFLQYYDNPLIITLTNGNTSVNEQGTTSDTYQVRLYHESGSSPVAGNVAVTLTGDGQVAFSPAQLVFTPANWSVNQTVTITAIDDSVLESDPHTGHIHYTLSSADPRYNGVSAPDTQVTITENDCGAWGYLNWDYNYDCGVNIEDFALLALEWVGTVDTLQQFSADWLKTTQPFAQNAIHGTVQDTPNVMSLHSDIIENNVDEKIYGHFFEHIYHSANGGLWGELVWNRSMEMTGSGGTWSIDGSELVQSSLGTNIRLMFGDTSWTNYEFTCEAQTTGGSEGFLLIVRASGNRFYWANLGGWGNSRHQFEKGNDDGTWGAVGSSSSGSITANQWYALRVRCENGRLRAYVDGVKKLDYTDSAGYLSGQVGLGTWTTQARFRNIAVKDLSGNVLFSGLPSLPPQPLPAFWTSYGTGQSGSSSQAYNDDYGISIANTGTGEAGIQQTPFNITVQSYTGSLWARGNGSLVVRLINGAQVLAQTSLGTVTSAWAEYPFTLTPGSAAGDAALQIGLTGAGTIWLDQVSLMGQDSLDTGGYRPDLLDAVKGLKAPVIRWPGGCYASAYRWKDGIGPQHSRHKYPLNLWDDQDVNSYGTDEFLRMCEALGVEPVIVINTGVLNSTCGVGPIPHPSNPDEYLQDVLDWMEYCNGSATSIWGSVRAANGHPEPYHVKYWEIDNETWAAGSAAYIAKVQGFVPAMKAYDPDIRVIACGGGGFDQSWNQAILNQCADMIDYISVHHYESPDAFEAGPRNYEAFIVQLKQIITSCSNPNVKIFMSEWNAQSTDWRTGLYAGGMLNGFERQGDVFEIGAPALFLRHVSATGWDNAFINFDHKSWFAAPNYIVMKLWHDHFASYRVRIEGSMDALNMTACKSADGSRLYFKAVNPTASDVAVKLLLDDTFPAQKAIFELVAPGTLSARNTLANPNTVSIENGAVSVYNQAVRFTLPALSAGVVEIQK